MLHRAKDGSIIILGAKSGDVLGIGGFLLAVFANIWLIMQYLTGAEVTMFPPEQVDLWCSSTERRREYDESGRPVLKSDNSPLTKIYCEDSSSVTLVAHALAYSNSGADGYHAVIKDETVDLDLVMTDGKAQSLTLYWQYFTNITDSKIEKSVAVPVMIKGGEAIAHETQFYQRHYSSRPLKRLYWKDVIALIETGDLTLIKLS